MRIAWTLIFLCACAAPALRDLGWRSSPAFAQCDYEVRAASPTPNILSPSYATDVYAATERYNDLMARCIAAKGGR